MDDDEFLLERDLDELLSSDSGCSPPNNLDFDADELERLLNEQNDVNVLTEKHDQVLRERRSPWPIPIIIWPI
jgi:hypothetical protein